MTASRREVEDWLKDAITKRKKNPNITHLIVGLDPFDYDNFPIVIEGGSAACRERLDELTRTGNRADEVYDLRLDTDEQLAEHRAWHV
jgi:hypothetical protein